uniref:Uncharacterized protein n=1 Tax=Candidatus Kentrum sp. FW TaxID=2126338 RepID=A0A450T944_9GAMM|nr:MAG: hypothetical protein BECKFW1821A_GA0114235_11433 [Candidatus Kentron sp. FW]
MRGAVYGIFPGIAGILPAFLRRLTLPGDEPALRRDTREINKLSGAVGVQLSYPRLDCFGNCLDTNAFVSFMCLRWVAQNLLISGRDCKKIEF